MVLRRPPPEVGRGAARSGLEGQTYSSCPTIRSDDFVEQVQVGRDPFSGDPPR